jgi:hypothetical protein
VVVVAPAHFLGFEAIDVFLRDNSGFSALAIRRHQGLFR